MNCFSLLSSAELMEEMRLRVDQVLSIWKNRDRFDEDDSGDPAYHFPLPWYPHQMQVPAFSSSSSATTMVRFYTNIMKDTTDLLIHYIREAKINKDSISQTYHREIDILDMKVYLAYLYAFQYLAQAYQNALTEKDGTWHSMPMDEFNEYTTFLFSIVNDLQAILSQDETVLDFQYVVPTTSALVMQSEEVKVARRKVRQTFEETRLLALDQLAAMIFLFALDSQDRELISREQKLVQRYIEFYEV